MNKSLVCKAILSLQITLLSTAVIAQQAEQSSNSPNVREESDYWFDGDKKRRIWKSVDEVVIFANQNQLSAKQKRGYLAQSHQGRVRSSDSVIPGAKVIESNEAWTRVRLTQQEYQSSSVKTFYRAQTQGISNSPKILPVFYTAKGESSAPYIATGEMIVHFNEKRTQEFASQWGKQNGVYWVKSLNLGNAFLYSCGDRNTCLEKANEAYHQPKVRYAYPNWLRPKSRQDHGSSSTNDSLFPDQWYLENVGQLGGSVGEDINMIAAWDRGHGSHDEIIAIVDDGLKTQHEDLIDNVISGLSWDFIEKDSDPEPWLFDEHGTNVAGLAAARGGNGKGISGVAPHAGLVGLRLLGAETASNTAAALTHKYERIDIYNCSWGIAGNDPFFGASLAEPSLLEKIALKDRIRKGRGGKGSIYVFSGGNGREGGENSNYDGFANSPYTITVAASTNQGKQASYSERGANLWVNAPSSEGTSRVVTTATGDWFWDGLYTHDFSGTSAAAPQVSGVIALMLKQNPELGWRDVQHILAKTAYRNDSVDLDWTENGAGYGVNHKYGFGRVDAAEASRVAASWTLLPPQASIEYSVQPNVLIPDDDSVGIRSTIMVPDDLSIDYVEVSFRSEHNFWGDLEITLISPEGTSSILAESNFRFGDDYGSGWRFGVARLLDESSQGIWTLQVKDVAPIAEGHLQDWSVKIYGRQSNINLDQFMGKCISKYPMFLGNKVGGSYTCGDGKFVCQNTTGGSAENITVLAVKNVPNNETLWYYHDGWKTIGYSDIGYCI